MTSQRLHFVSAVILALAAPALAQTAGSPIPDFSGFWTHAALGFESPLTGPGPVTNTSRMPSGVGNFDKLVGDYTNPILKPETAAAVKKFGEISLSGRAFPDPDNQCRLNPVPYIFWNFEIQLLQQKDTVTILYPHDQDRRVIKLNQNHPANVTPSIHGDSVGHYEGDTLVVDTVGIKVSPYPMVDRFGTPYTDSLHVIERYRRLPYEKAREAYDRAGKEWPHIGGGYAPDPNDRGNGLQLEFTVEDAGAFTTPWTATISYLRSSHDMWEERVCAENIGHYYGGSQYYSDPTARVPTADKPDF